MLLDSPNTGAQTEQITPQEAQQALATGIWGEDPALRLVCGDAERAEAYEASKSWLLGWPQALALYQSPSSPRFWEGTQTERASIPMFTVANAVNAITPQIMGGLFYDDPPFMFSPKPGTRDQAAQAMAAVIGFQLEDINFREELRLGINNVALFGTGIWKWGWETYTRKRRHYERAKPSVVLPNQVGGVDMGNITVRDDQIEEVEVEETVDRPTFTNIEDLTTVLVDPTLNRPDIRKAKYVVHRMYMTFDDLDKLRDRPGYKIPSRKELLDLFLPPREPVEEGPIPQGSSPQVSAEAKFPWDDATMDPFSMPLEVLERWDNDTCIVVLQKKLVLCNDHNPYECIPYLSVNWWDVPKAFYGLGLARLIGSEQRLQQGITNTWLDQANLALNGMYVRVRGKSVPTQNIRIAPGRVIDVDNKDDFKPLDRIPAVPEAGQHISLSMARAEQTSGANQAATQGIAGATGHSNLARSAAGAQLIASGASSRVDDFVEKLSDQVFVPFLQKAVELDRKLLPLSTLRTILSEELQHEFVADASNDVADLLNVRARISISAGAKLRARRAMAQSLPLLTQFLTNMQTENQLAIQGLKIDIAEIIRMFFEVSEWKTVNDVLVPMTPEDTARWQSMQAGAQQQGKLAGQMQLQQQKFEQSQQLSDQENTARAAREVLRQALEKSTAPMAINGEPGDVGFGSNA